VEVQVVRPSAVRERIDTDDRVEEFRGEGQRSGVHLNGKDSVLDAGIPDELKSLRDAGRQVGGPDLYVELAPKKD
jgi:hypothetical protein